VESEAYFDKNRPTIFYNSKKYMPIFSSRACPFKCSYCHHIFGKRFRGRSARNVLDELRELYHNHGIREFEFYDDCFNADKRRCKEILRLFASSEMEDATLQFPNGFRADILDDEIIELLGRARVFSISIGVESGSARIQKLIGKNVNLERLESSVAKVSRQGVLLHGFFMFGFPTETLPEMNQTIALAKRLEIDTASFFILNPFKGTELASNTTDSLENREYDYFRVKHNLSHVSDKDLTSILRRAYAEFYFSPKRAKKITRALWSCPQVVKPGIRILVDRLFFIGAGKS
jgi:anaerobic magnesium-protoporphyrin IX monomethyl ester cyclase